MHFNRALLLIPLLAACAAPDGEYPSLALRPAELATITPAPAAPAPPPPTPAAVLAQLEQLTADATSAHRTFLAQVPDVRSAVAAAGGAAEGSEAWSVAQVTLAGLEAARSRAMIALADLDRLYVDAAVAGAALDRIGAARDAVAAQVEQQDATISGLSGNLR